MRIVENTEATRLEPFINHATEQVRLSPCKKSQRGAVIFKGERILGQGFNAPIPPEICTPELCMSVCRFHTIHAERRACYDALAKGFDLKGASILHMKIKNGQVVPVQEASCLDCSAYLMGLKRDGILLHELILLHEDGGKLVYKAHTINEFFQNSLRTLK